MMRAAPHRLLLIRPDVYGDLVLFEPVLRILRERWGRTEIAVLIQERYADLTPLLTPGVRWLTTRCDPYRDSPASNPAALEVLGRQVADFAPDCVVACCYDKTWLEAAVATFAPAARQICLGSYDLDLISKIILQKTLSIQWPKIYGEMVAVERDCMDWEKNLQLAGYLLGEEVPRRGPIMTISEATRRQALSILASAGLAPAGFAACCPAGTAKVSIKAWPAERYGQTLAWLEKEHGTRALLLGHESERDILRAVEQVARAAGASPVLWTGSDGQIALLAGLIEQSRLYFGNDTGALHFAGALGRPVAGIFGGGTWPRFKPVAHRAVSVVQPLPCFGCAWECSFGDAPCLRTISPEAVRQALGYALASNEEERKELLVEDGVTAAERALMARVAATVNKARHIEIGGAGGGRELLSRAVLEQLLAQLEFSEADRAARLKVIEQQGTEMGGLLQGAGLPPEPHKALVERLSELDEIRTTLLGAIEKSQAELSWSAAECARQAEAINAQAARLSALDRERAELLAGLETVRRDLAASEAGRARQAELLHNQSVELDQRQQLLQRLQEENISLSNQLAAQTQALEQALDALAAARLRLRELQAALSRIDEHWVMRLLKSSGLWSPRTFSAPPS